MPLCDRSVLDTPLPTGWAKDVKSAVFHVISLAHFAISAARGWAANNINARVGLASENGRLKQEIDLLREEVRIKDARRKNVAATSQPLVEGRDSSRGRTGLRVQVVLRRRRKCEAIQAQRWNLSSSGTTAGSTCTS